jgi:hypothetical protein
VEGESEGDVLAEAVVNGVGGAATTEERPRDHPCRSSYIPIPMSPAWDPPPPRAVSPRPARRRGRVGAVVGW